MCFECDKVFALYYFSIKMKQVYNNLHLSKKNFNILLDSGATSQLQDPDMVIKFVTRYILRMKLDEIEKYNFISCHYRLDVYVRVFLVVSFFTIFNFFPRIISSNSKHKASFKETIKENNEIMKSFYKFLKNYLANVNTFACAFL